MIFRTLQRAGLLLWGVLGTFSAGGDAAADTLKIETETTVEVSADRVTAAIAVSNRGTAPASDVQVHLTALTLTDASPVMATLDPGQTKKAFFKREIKGGEKGRYPMTVRVDFHDANQYPFSALSGMTFVIGEAVNPDLAALTEDMTLTTSGVLRFDVKNLGLKPLKIISSLVLPKEFSAPQPRSEFDIDQRSEKTVGFQIRNFSALAGAEYPVFCYFEYDSDGIHHTALARSQVTVGADETLFRRFRWAWITLAGILGALLIVVLMRDRRKQSPGAGPGAK